MIKVGQVWKGPLPSPDDLARFSHVVENGAERVFREWEQEAQHRRDYEMVSLKWWLGLDLIGRIFAFVFALVALGATMWLASIGQSTVAGIVGGGTIGAVVTALVYRGREQGKAQVRDASEGQERLPNP